MKKKVLFIDRDGTMIKETVDEQIDAFEKMIFYPKAFTFLGKIAKELDFELVMITNQDGLGTDVFPEDTFWPVHNFIMKSFENDLSKDKFIRVHKSYIINIDKVERFNSKFAEIGITKIPLSRNKKEDLIRALAIA